jgi:hypothetical protein
MRLNSFFPHLSSFLASFKFSEGGQGRRFESCRGGDPGDINRGFLSWLGMWDGFCSWGEFSMHPAPKWDMRTGGGVWLGMSAGLEPVGVFHILLNEATSRHKGETL